MSKLVTGNEFSAMTKPEQYQLYLDMRWELNDLQVKFDSLNTELLASRKRDKAFREWLAKYKSTL
ncbi:MAG: hypothetical protein PHE17_19370 [Thiothrix sp.]|uniref:hypothetical protein n=1 Tax=Thiothrix sp. TaxID=1032 RepID=UPI002621F5FC|nr:hypothetical protein [Thiothrix sp.]MDD5395188.1 hypothetical protein [Thiothrix sp.]